MPIAIEGCYGVPCLAIAVVEARRCHQGAHSEGRTRMRRSAGEVCTLRMLGAGEVCTLTR